MSEPPPKDWLAVRARLRARLPRLLASIVLGVIVFTAIPYAHGASLTRAVIYGLVAVGTIIVLVVVVVGGVVSLMSKTRPPNDNLEA